MLTNTLLLYMTQEALAKARERLTPRKDEAAADEQRASTARPAAWQLARRGAAKARPTLRH